MADPITPLTAAEQAFVDRIDATWTRDEVLARLKADLQTAITIELATVPIYLFTYYSLIRNNEVGETISPAQLYANKAGGIIMSVAVEEMLHLSLSSNILFAMGVAPKLYGQAPASYPTGLPYHNPKGPAGPDGDTAVKIPLARLGYEQLWHFLQIEYPQQWDALPQDSDWDTIGQFYSFIRCLMSSRFLTDADFQLGAVASAIQPVNYSPNNIDTVYPTGGFDPWKPAPPAPTPGWADPVQGAAAAAAVYPDAEDSYAGRVPLLAISSVAEAIAAIDTICDQGEGTPVAHVGPSPDDDPTDGEESHYSKFLKLQAQFADYAGTHEQRPPHPPAPSAVIEPAVTGDQLVGAGVLANFADNPVAADYPLLYRDIANFSSALFQYMLVMIETIYLVPPASQKLFFNEGLHRSMIWVMDKYFRTIRQLPITDGPYKGTTMAPTFENVSLGAQAVSFAGLTAYGQKAIAAANALIALIDIEEVIHDIALWLRGAPPLVEPNDPTLVRALQNVIYYVGVALTKTGTDGGSMHLPDVGPYWIAAAAKAGATTAAPAPAPPAGQPVPTPYPYAGEPVFPTTIGSQPAGMPLHACMGLNSCKASDRYGALGNSVSGVNECAGQGYCSTGADHTCHVQNECAGQGGCGLYGTAEELDRPGANACRSLGSCASPINAERFSTNGPNRGKSVWLRAREVFEANWADNRTALLARQREGMLAPDQVIPETPGQPPAAFAGAGPSYLWISEDNTARGNMTACGSNGMSGAGGCS